MKKKTITIMVGILFLLSCVSALNLNAGECSVLDIQVEGEVTWTAPEGIYITQNGSEIEICLDILFESGNFSLEFFNEQKEIIVNHYSSGGGGGGSSKTIYEDRDVITYREKEVDVPGETIELPGEIVDKIPKSLILFLVIAVIIAVGAMGLYLVERAKKGDEINVPIQDEPRRVYEGM